MDTPMHGVTADDHSGVYEWVQGHVDAAGFNALRAAHAPQVHADNDPVEDGEDLHHWWLEHVRAAKPEDDDFRFFTKPKLGAVPVTVIEP